MSQCKSSQPSDEYLRLTIFGVAPRPAGFSRRDIFVTIYYYSKLMVLSIVCPKGGIYGGGRLKSETKLFLPPTYAIIIIQRKG